MTKMLAFRRRLMGVKLRFRNVSSAVIRQAGSRVSLDHMEALERRLLLVAHSVLDVTPAANSIVAAESTELRVLFDQDIDQRSAIANPLVPHATQSGRVRNEDLIVSIQGSEVHSRVDSIEHAGEQIEVTATTRFTNSDAELAMPYVWRYRTSAVAGTGWFGRSEQFDTASTRKLALGDLDGDGDLDVFSAKGRFQEMSPNTIWLNDGQGSFVESGQRLGTTTSTDVALGDLDDDGDLDALVASIGNPSSTYEVWLNGGDADFKKAPQDFGQQFGYSVALGDLDGDGDLDAILASESEESPHGGSIWINDGRARFERGGSLFGRLRLYDMEIGDLDNDGDLDVWAAAENEIWLNDGQAAFTEGRHLGGFARAVALGDVDGDGDLDAWVASLQSDADVVWLNDGSAGFSSSGQRLGDERSQDVALVDVDADGDLDAVTAGNEFIWLNDGHGVFQRTRPVSLSTPGRHPLTLSNDIVAGDVDGDGDVDVLLSVYGEPNEVWLNADVQYDLEISSDNGRHFAQRGATATFHVTVNNHGPDFAPMASVNVTVPLEDAIWVCSPTPGSKCTLAGTGQLQDTVALPPGGHVEYTLKGMVPPGTSGTLASVATVSTLDDRRDIEPGNNVATDVDALLPLQFDPPLNTTTAPRDGPIEVIFPETLDPATVTEQTFTVHAAQTGQLVLHRLEVDGPAVRLTPGRARHAG